MSDAVWLALFAMIGTSIASTVASILSYLKSRDAMDSSRDAVDASRNNAEGIQGVHVLINSQLAAWKKDLVDSTEVAIRAAFAKGVVKGESNERVKALVVPAPVVVPSLSPDHVSSDMKDNTDATIANTAAIAGDKGPSDRKIATEPKQAALPETPVLWPPLTKVDIGRIIK